MEAGQPKKLRVRIDNPCVGIVPPDMDDAKELQWLYPDEFMRLMACELVPLAARRLYALAVYLFVRAGELKALDWSDVDIERGIVSIRVAWDRETDEVKQTKTGNKSIRRFAIEPNLLPLLRAMHAARAGRDDAAAEVVGGGPAQASRGRSHRPRRAVSQRRECKRLRFHDLRGTGLTWMAIRGDDPLKIQQRAGHTSFEMTQKYIRTAEAVGEAIGGVFPPLPTALLCPLNGLANRPSDPQAIDIIVEAPGIEPLPPRRLIQCAAEPLEQGHDLRAAELVEGAVGDEDAGDVADVFAHDEVVLAQGFAGFDEVDDDVGQAHERGELDGAAHVDDFGLDAALGEVFRGDAGELGGDARDAGGGVDAGGAGHDHAAFADAELDGLVQVVGSFEQHVAAADAEVGDAVFDVGRDVVGLEQQEAQRAVLGFSDQFTLVGEEVGGVDAGAFEERGEGLHDAALGDREGERRHGRCHGMLDSSRMRSMSAPAPASLLSMCS